VEEIWRQGIKVCEEWQKFPVFARWARSNGYQNDLSIDRIDGDGDYSPENCRWADVLTQSLNKKMPKNNISGYRGVSKRKEKWCAQITAYCVTMYLGLFDDPAEAARAYDRKAFELHGSEAKVNFPTSGD
jgi:hypothetical protein